MKNKRLLLVYPRNTVANYADATPTWLYGKKGVFLNSSLATVAALTLPGYEIAIVDENVETIDFDGDYDLVGITGFHFQLPRARRIAEAFSSRGVPVVCGGPSVALSPERWRPFADILVIGEAERIWPQFATDFLHGRYEAEYRERERPDLTRSPLPDYSGMSPSNRNNYMIGVVQTSRGCPYNCEFCSVHVYLGHRMRYKSIAQVLAELNQLYAMGLRFVFLADDNFYGGKNQARYILAAIRDWNHAQREPVSLVTQLSIDAANDPEFMKLASEAGLRMVYVGIESPNPESLRESRKLHNLHNDMRKNLEAFSAYGIMVIGSTIVGFDHDDLSIFQQQFDFFRASGIPRIHVYPLQALDSTRLKDTMVRQNRYLEWQDQLPADDGKSFGYNNFDTFSIVPARMSLEQLRHGLYWLVWNLYDLDQVAGRTVAMFDAFDQAGHGKRFHFPRRPFTLKGLKALGRVVRYFLTEASGKERRIFRKMAKRARTSSFPRPMEAALGSFFAAKNVQQILLNQLPEVADLDYPH